MENRYEHKAFLAYSHKDHDFAVWLHRSLESWRIPRDLVGRETPVGQVPRRLRIFRDRDDFAGGPSLKEATIRALEASEFLVVLCSPHSANSPYVNEEVRLFKALGRSDQVLPVILAGEPGGGPIDECFPDAVRFHVGEDGTVTSDPAEPIAPDARDKGDGRNRALAKVVAGLLGVAFDEIVRRAERARRGRMALMVGTGVGAIIFATGFASFALYQTYQASVTISRSVSAIGGLIRTTDDLSPDSDIQVIRASMIREQCDLMEGLASGRTEINRIETAICRSDQAAAVADRGDRQGALTGFQHYYDNLLAEFRATKAPTHDLSQAVLRAALGHSWLLPPTEDGAISEKALRGLADVAEEVGWARPDIGYARRLHEDAVWKLLPILEGQRNWSAAFGLMERAAALRARQATAEDESRLAGWQGGVYLRRLSWMAQTHLDRIDEAINLGLQSVDVLGRNVSPKPAAEDLYQLALAQQVLADARARRGDRPAASVGYRRALDLLTELRRRFHPEVDLSEAVTRETIYLQTKLEGVGK